MIVGSSRMNEIIWKEYRNEKKREWGMPMFKGQVLRRKMEGGREGKRGAQAPEREKQERSLIVVLDVEKRECPRQGGLKK